VYVQITYLDFVGSFFVYLDCQNAA